MHLSGRALTALTSLSWSIPTTSALPQIPIPAQPCSVAGAQLQPDLCLAIGSVFPAHSSSAAWPWLWPCLISMALPRITGPKGPARPELGPASSPQTRLCTRRAEWAEAEAQAGGLRSLAAPALTESFWCPSVELHITHSLPVCWTSNDCSAALQFFIREDTLVAGRHLSVLKYVHNMEWKFSGLVLKKPLSEYSGASWCVQGMMLFLHCIFGELSHLLILQKALLSLISS